MIKKPKIPKKKSKTRTEIPLFSRVCCSRSFFPFFPSLFPQHPPPPAGSRAPSRTRPEKNEIIYIPLFSFFFSFYFYFSFYVPSTSTSTVESSLRMHFTGRKPETCGETCGKKGRRGRRGVFFITKSRVYKFLQTRIKIGFGLFCCFVLF